MKKNTLIVIIVTLLTAGLYFIVKSILDSKN